MGGIGSGNWYRYGTKGTTDDYRCLDVRDLHDAPDLVHETLMCLIKTREDKARFKPEVTAKLLGKVA